MDITARPVNLSERSDILDVLRGFALIGVLLDNLFGFTGWGNLLQPTREAMPTWPADGILGLLEIAFVHGKFYSLFSILFGIGFSIILIRNEQKGINPFRIFYRRLFILAIFGFLHCYFLWEGDILLLYALIGCLLPLFRRCKDNTLLIWAACLIFSPLLIDVLKVLFHFKTGSFLEAIAMRIDSRTGLPADDGWRTYLYGDAGWREWRNWQASGIYYRYAYIIESNRIPKVLGLFLLGFYAGRKMIYADLEKYKTFFKRLLKWGLIIGIPFSLAMAWFEIDEKAVPKTAGLLDTASYAFGVVPLALAYASALCLWWNRKKAKTKWKWLAPMGRMALTNYLMQTVAGIVIYYGVGFGLGGDIGPAIFIPIGLSFYAFQVIYSNIWFRYFLYGPMEWIWRQLTYGRRLPFIKKTS
jgi:uncharacterized protein